jgi:hypothetical protein
MKMVLFGMLFVGQIALAAGGIMLTTLSGQPAEVSADEVLKAYANLQTDPPENVQIHNMDGSISVLNPRVMYAGKWVELLGESGDTDEAKDNKMGLCKLLGLGKTQAVEAGWFTQDGKIQVYVTSDGRFAGTKTNYPAATSVTCGPL